MFFFELRLGWDLEFDASSFPSLFEFFQILSHLWASISIDDTNRLIASGVGGGFAELEQQLPDFLGLKLVGPEDQLIAAGIDPDAQRVLGLFLFISLRVVIEERVPPGIFLFVLVDPHERADGSGDLFGPKSSQRDDLGLSGRAIEFLERFLDGQMIGKGGISDHRFVFVVGFQASGRFQDVQSDQRADELLGLKARQAIDLHACRESLVLFVRTGNIDAGDEGGDDGHFIGGSIDDDAVSPGVGDQVNFASSLGRRLGSLTSLLGGELLLDHHLLLGFHLLGAHATWL